MGESRPIRLPLQIGIQALYSLAFAGATFVPGVVALVATLYLLIVKGGLLVFLLVSQGWLIAATIVALEIILLRYGINHLRLALRTRPADVVFADAGLRVVGGPLHGRSIAWSGCEAIREETHRLASVDDVERWRAVIERVDGSKLVVAEAADDIELASLRALCDSVRARLHRGALAPLPPEEHPDLLRCPACAAPAAPLDADRTTCAFCAATVPIPTSLRERLRATDEVLASSRVSAPLLAKLLAQPSARDATRLSILAGIPIAAIWIVAVFFAIALYAHDGLRFGNVALLAVSATSTILACYYLLRFWFVNRIALGVITLSFGALPPASDGAPWTCRSCGAPLPPALGGLLARCAWCGADNVLGIDLRPRAEGARKERAVLETAFARREQDRRKYALRALASVAVLPLALWGAFAGSRAITRDAKYAVACDRGELPACIDLGRFYLETFNDSEARRVFDRACKRGSLDACAELGHVLARGDEQALARGLDLLWRHCQDGHAGSCATLGRVVKARRPPGDLPGPNTLFRRACDAGNARGCALLGEELVRGIEVAKDEAGAARLFEQSCRDNDAYGCAHLAQLLFEGIAVPQDVPRAIAMFQQGCTHVWPTYLACAGLGNAYSLGRGVPRDGRKAWDLLLRSCKNGGIASACTRIGEIQEADGYLQRALEQYVAACSSDDLGGCLGLASVFVKRDDARSAIHVLRRACLEQHMGLACAGGGMWLERGKHGLAVDVKQAAELYTAGCALGDRDSCDLGRQLADRPQAK